MMLDMLSLRPAHLQDNAFIRELFAAALPLYQNLMPGSLEANLENMDILTEKGLAFNATGLDGWIFEHGLNSHNQPVGFAGIGPLNPDQAYMASLYFLPAQQRQGFGQQALNLLEFYYAGLGFKTMLLLVHHQAHWALNFYTRNGYLPISDQLPEIIAYGGEQLRHLHEPGLELMAKTLSSQTPTG